ncbi:TPA: tail fiber assembly protein [Escherichia coli]|nr:tail fiber assembly protein [Escherichia coli]
MIFTNFKKYIPEDPELKELVEAENILFLRCDQGYDWYDLRSTEFNNDKMKVVFDDQNRIVFWNTDPTLLCPEDLSIAQVDFNIDTFEDIRNKVLDLETLTLKDKEYSREELMTQASAKIRSLQETAVALITPLQYAKDLEMATEDELAYLKNLQVYVVKLNRVPLQKDYPYAIDWPTLPTK